MATPTVRTAQTRIPPGTPVGSTSRLTPQKTYRRPFLDTHTKLFLLVTMVFGPFSSPSTKTKDVFIIMSCFLASNVLRCLTQNEWSTYVSNWVHTKIVVAGVRTVHNIQVFMSQIVPWTHRQMTLQVWCFMLVNAYIVQKTAEAYLICVSSSGCIVQCLCRQITSQM